MRVFKLTLSTQIINNSNFSFSIERLVAGGGVGVRLGFNPDFVSFWAYFSFFPLPWNNPKLHRSPSGTDCHCTFLFSLSDGQWRKSTFYQRATRGLLKDVWVVGSAGTWCGGSVPCAWVNSTPCKWPCEGAVSSSFARLQGTGHLIGAWAKVVCWQCCIFGLEAWSACKQARLGLRVKGNRPAAVGPELLGLGFAAALAMLADLDLGQWAWFWRELGPGLGSDKRLQHDKWLRN